jgi:putative copper resistance protein D
VISPETVLIVCRFAFEAAIVYLWGTSAYLAAAVPRPLGHAVAARLAPMQAIATALLIITMIAALPVNAATVGEGWRDGVDGSVIADMLAETGVGHAWLAAMLGAALLPLCWLLKGTRRQAALAGTSACLLATLAMTGHAAMDAGWLGLAHRVNHILHLLAGGAWLGGLVPFLVILPRLDEPGARLALIRYSTLGHVAVALVIVTGMINTALIVGGLPTDWAFPYQLILSAKILLVAVMVGLALANRYVYVPQLSANKPQALKALARGTIREIVLGAAVIATVAWFGTLEPR